MHSKVGTQISFVNPQIANPHILGLIPQSNSQISELCQSANRNPQKIIGSPNHKSAKCHICGGSANLKSLSAQIFGFAICGTYLRTAHLCLYYTYIRRDIQEYISCTYMFTLCIPLHIPFGFSFCSFGSHFCSKYLIPFSY